MHNTSAAARIAARRLAEGAAPPSCFGSQKRFWRGPNAGPLASANPGRRAPLSTQRSAFGGGGLEFTPATAPCAGPGRSASAAHQMAVVMRYEPA
jgi:hypothetical protein